MEARRIRLTALGMATVVTFILAARSQAQFGPEQQHVAQSQNFIVFAASPQLAARVSQAAEEYRKDLAIYWLDHELPAWSQRCPIHVTASPRLGAGGETRFSPIPGGVGNWMMQVQGTEERVLDSVLPHEITHTIFATHFAPFNRLPPFDRYLPRWADEGACTTVEHIEEKSKHQHFLQDFLRTGRGIAFNKMFSLKEYPKDILPLYAQGHSVVQFLLDQGGPRKFVAFLEDGMRNGAWQAALKNQYEYETIGELQTQWNRWLRDGSPTSLVGYAPSLDGKAPGAIALASASEVLPPSRAQSQPNSGSTTAGSFERRTPPHQILAQAAPNPQNGLAHASYASGDSWYRSRLRAVSSGAGQDMDRSHATSSATPNVASDGTLTKQAASSGNYATTQTYPAQAHQTSRQTEARPQRSQIRVLDWGNSDPVTGIASQAEMVPLR